MIDKEFNELDTKTYPDGYCSCGINYKDQGLEYIQHLIIHYAYIRTYILCMYIPPAIRSSSYIYNNLLYIMHIHIHIYYVYTYLHSSSYIYIYTYIYVAYRVFGSS